MISINNLNKEFKQKDNKIHAVKNVNLEIEKNSIHGIVGYSGAGKSTLLRMINLLEKPDSGQILIDGVDLTKLKGKNLREERKNIGMIFQNFNLFNLRTVYENIAFPLYRSNLSKKEINFQVSKLLELVELKDKKDSYPSSLSGGQKQRVAIARSLANNPKILLCDEATSALDPKTTKSILKLLKKVNQDLGVTIVIITHEMDVIKEICTNVSVMKDGEIIFTSHVLDLFTNVSNKEINSFLDRENNIEKLKRNEKVSVFENYKKVLKLSYLGEVAHEAIISQISREYDVDVSILFGNIEYINKVFVGQIIIGLSGQKEKIAETIKYLENKGLTLEEIYL